MRIEYSLRKIRNTRYKSYRFMGSIFGANCILKEDDGRYIVPKEAYCTVFSAFRDIDETKNIEDILEGIYYDLQDSNLVNGMEYFAESGSTSDIISIRELGQKNEKHYFVDSFGFKEIEFEE